MRRRSLLALGLAAAGPPRLAWGTDRTVRVGTVPGPHAEILRFVGALMAAQGVELHVDAREAGRSINADVARGALDAACFQNGVAFANESARRPTPLIEVARTVTLPFAIYSRRAVSLRALPLEATIAVPAEAGAMSRSLVLLHNHGLVELRPGVGLTAKPKDVVRNRHGFHLVPTARARLADALQRIDAAVLDHPTAEQARLLPARDSIGLEDARTPWADILAVRARDRDAAWLHTLLTAYRADPVKRFIRERFQDSVRRPW